MSLDLAARLFLKADSWAGHPGHVRDISYPVPRNTEGGQRDRQGHTPIGGVPLSRPSIPHCFVSDECEAVHGRSIVLVTTDAIPSRSRQQGVDGSLSDDADRGATEPQHFARCSIFRFEFPI